MIKLPYKAAILLWHGIDKKAIPNNEHLAYAIMTLDSALDAAMPDWGSFSFETDGCIDVVVKEIQKQRVDPLSEMDSFGMLEVPWTEEQLNAIAGPVIHEQGNPKKV